jgi:PPK2 family polyphosphate:nucleotide phosphotransferase
MARRPRAPAPASDPLAPYRVDGAADGARRAKPFDLARVDPGAKPFSGDDKHADKARVAALAERIDALQDLLYADRRYKVLVVLQGTDTSGKDGTIRGVFGRTSALGVQTSAWKAPTEEERAHDFLWRLHRRTPGAGEIAIWNRSHYEDVLVPVVRGWIDAAETEKRFGHIRDFERLLADSGTVVLKFLLHISKDEQRERLQARLDEPDKTWKFNAGDLEDRRRWDDFQHAYGAAIAATGTPWAPWIVVPADSKTHRNLMVAMAVVQALESLKLRYPPPPPELAGLRVA